MDEENEIESPTKTVEKRSKKESKKVKRKKTNGDGSTKSRKKSVKKESTKNIAASSEEDLEDIYRSEANLIPEPPQDQADDVDEAATIPKKSISRKKRRPKLSTKRDVDQNEIENSRNYFNDEDPEFFPDPNLRLAIESLREDVESLVGDLSPTLSPGSQQLAAPPSSSVGPTTTSTMSQHFPLLESFQPTFPASQPVKQIYLQDGSGFSKANHRKLTKLSLATQIQPSSLKASMTPLDLGLESQKVFRSIGIFCHGFLAGLAFWQLIMVFVLADGDMDILDFIALYSPLSQPLHLIFYFLTVICTISILDRYDLAQFEWVQIQKMLTFHSGGIAIFVYLLSLMLTLVTTRLDDKISLYHINATLFEQSDPTELESEISSWKILNLCRSLGVIVGWILVSLRPNTDLLYKHLKKLADFSSVSREAKNQLA